MTYSSDDEMIATRAIGAQIADIMVGDHAESMGQPGATDDPVNNNIAFTIGAILAAYRVYSLSNKEASWFTFVVFCSCVAADSGYIDYKLTDGEDRVHSLLHSLQEMHEKMGGLDGLRMEALAVTPEQAHDIKQQIPGMRHVPIGGNRGGTGSGN